jgi:hypothetical protein
MNNEKLSVIYCCCDGSFESTVLVTDGMHVDAADVVIVVGDVNDNAPSFHRTAYNVDIIDDADAMDNTGAAEGDDVILKLFAYDADEGSNGLVTYWISGE